MPCGGWSSCWSRSSRTSRNRARSRENSKGKEQGGEQGSQPPGDGIPSLAQLKLLKLMQEDVNERTKALQEAFQRKGNLSPEQLQEYSQLSEEQTQLADMVLNLSKPSDKPPEDDPGQALAAGKGEVIDMIRILLAVFFPLGLAGNAPLSTEYSVLSPASDLQPAKPAQKKPSSSLDEEVLKGLGLDPALDDLAPGKEREARGKEVQARQRRLDKQLLEGLTEAKTSARQEIRWSRLGRRMQQAGELIGQNQERRRNADAAEADPGRSGEAHQAGPPATAAAATTAECLEPATVAAGDGQPVAAQQVAEQTVCAEQSGQQSTDRVGKNDVRKRRSRPGERHDQEHLGPASRPGQGRDALERQRRVPAQVRAADRGVL